MALFFQQLPQFVTHALPYSHASACLFLPFLSSIVGQVKESKCSHVTAMQKSRMNGTRYQEIEKERVHVGPRTKTTRVATYITAVRFPLVVHVCGLFSLC